MTRTAQPIPPGAIDQAAQELAAPPIARPAGRESDSERAYYLRQWKTICWWQTITFVLGLLLCTVGYVIASAMHFSLQEQAAAVAGLRGVKPEAVYNPAPGTFWLGIALIAISQLQAIQAAIHEAHLVGPLDRQIHE